MRVSVSREQVLKAFELVEQDPVFSNSRKIVKDGGMPLEMIHAMCANPEVLQGFGALSSTLYPGGSLESEVKEIVILAASRENQCQFCMESHVDLAAAVGMEHPLELLDLPDQLTTRQQLARTWTLAVMQDSNRISDELFNQVHDCFGDDGIIELTMLVGYINMLNMFNNALQNRYHGEIS